jgi:hypothetical protein
MKVTAKIRTHVREKKKERPICSKKKRKKYRFSMKITAHIK